ncbi:MAG: hypothetical protein KDC24_02860 [Saprospiraceae bacterium]|nr:hypothetical protein [Saprospiraceae bacterium]
MKNLAGGICEMVFFIAVSMVLLVMVGCEHTPSSKDHKNKIKAALLMAEANVKTGIPLAKYDGIDNQDTLRAMIIDDAAKARYNVEAKYYLTESCIKDKLKDAVEEDYKSQYPHDSTLLEMIMLKSDEIVKSNEGNDTIRLIDIVLQTTKINHLTAEMHKVCPTKGKGLLLE